MQYLVTYSRPKASGYRKVFNLGGMDTANAVYASDMGADLPHPNGNDPRTFGCSKNYSSPAAAVQSMLREHGCEFLAMAPHDDAARAWEQSQRASKAPSVQNAFEAACERARLESLDGCARHVNGRIIEVAGTPTVSSRWEVADWFADGATVRSYINGAPRA